MAESLIVGLTLRDQLGVLVTNRPISTYYITHFGVPGAPKVHHYGVGIIRQGHLKTTFRLNPLYQRGAATAPRITARCMHTPIIQPGWESHPR